MSNINPNIRKNNGFEWKYPSENEIEITITNFDNLDHKKGIRLDDLLEQDGKNPNDIKHIIVNSRNEDIRQTFVKSISTILLTKNS